MADRHPPVPRVQVCHSSSDNGASISEGLGAEDNPTRPPPFPTTGIVESAPQPESQHIENKQYSEKIIVGTSPTKTGCGGIGDEEPTPPTANLNSSLLRNNQARPSAARAIFQTTSSPSNKRPAAPLAQLASKKMKLPSPQSPHPPTQINVDDASTTVSGLSGHSPKPASEEAIAGKKFGASSVNTASTAPIDEESFASTTLSSLASHIPKFKPSDFMGGSSGYYNPDENSIDSHIPNFRVRGVNAFQSGYISGCEDENDTLEGDAWKEDHEAIQAILEVALAREDALEEGVFENTVMEMTEDDYQRHMESKKSGTANGENEFEDIVVAYDKNTQTTLKKLAKEKDATFPVSGTKRNLFQKMSKAPWARAINDDTFVTTQKKKSIDSVPKWIILNGETADLPEQMGDHGATKGFFSPTNQEKVAMRERKNFLVNDKIKRPKFSHKNPKSTTNQNKSASKETNQGKKKHPPSEEGGPSQSAKDAIGDFNSARPIDFFNLIMTPKYRELCFTDCTNYRAYTEMAGRAIYKDYVPFTPDEIDAIIGLLFLNGLSPKPQMKMWFKNQTQDFCYGNDAIWFRFHADREKPSGERRWKHFRRFFCMYDSRYDPKSKVKENPFWKVDTLLQELRKNSMKNWVTGKWVAIDEQTIGFQGKHGLKLRITYKKEGDGFQCDAVCDDGYTFNFFFQHGEAPDVGHQDLDLSPTARRVIYLVRSLSNSWTRVTMDNLFNSKKLFTAGYAEQVLMQGVVRTNHRGLCQGVIQKEEKNTKKAEQLRGRTKVAIEKDNPRCPDLVSMSVYDTKPVHMLSSVAECVEWIAKEQKVWSKESEMYEMMEFLRLNMVNNYNEKMGDCDVADQLRNQYRPDHWMRNSKWWWPIFLWGLGLSAINGYKLYTKMHALEKKKKKAGLKPLISHADFQRQLAMDLIWPKSNGLTSPESAVDATNNEIDLSTHEGREKYLKEHRPCQLRLWKQINNNFPHRFDGKFHPSVPAPGSHYCQLCWFLKNDDGKGKTKLDETVSRRAGRPKEEEKEESQRNYTDVSRCLRCKLYLCCNCFMAWHGRDPVNPFK